MKTADPHRYHEVARQLQEQVRRGELKPGQRLPSFAQMRAQGLSQHTMEKAYALLESEGVIERLGGSGIYVSQPRPMEPAMIGAFGPTPPQYEASGGHLYWMQLLSGVQDEAQKSGATVVLLGEDTRSAAWEKVDSVLGIGIKNESEIPAEIQALADARTAAKQARDFKKSDAIRDELKAKGWVIEDTPKGIKLKKI